MRFSTLALVAGIACGGVQSARATVLYAYAQQSTSGYSFSGGSFGPFSPNTHTSAAQNANPTGNQAQSGTLDAMESYVGPAAAKPAENSFTPKGQNDADYSRGDALVAQRAIDQQRRGAVPRVERRLRGVGRLGVHRAVLRRHEQCRDDLV
jgi:hypothetical protein